MVKRMGKRFSVFGIGNPLMDFVVYTDHACISSLGSKPGTTTIIDEKKVEEIFSIISSWSNIPGGSCANTLRGIAWLSIDTEHARPVYSGAVGRDEVGEQYIRMMEKDYGIIPLFPVKNKKTGLSIVMVTPDYERTMFTYLGACEDFDVDDLDFPALSEAAFLHFTGYMWCTEHQKKAIQTAVDFCREKNIRISFDCADPLMVKFYKDEFLSWIPGHVDVLFGNREEISEMIGQEGKDEDIARQAGNLADIVIMKIGAEGCIVVHQGKLLRIPGLKVDAIDTVGAGDAFASGFLYGLLQGRDIETCSILANTLAASIVTVEGCNFMKCDKGTILDGVL